MWRGGLACALASVLLALASASSAASRAQVGPADGVVKVLATGEDGLVEEGSGFVVGFDRGVTFVATAAHVVGSDPSPRVVFAASPHLTYPVMSVRIAGKADVALLKVYGLVTGVAALPLDERPAARADAISVLGFPRRADQPRWASATVASIEGDRIVLDRSIARGTSGGPLLRSGWVVGLVQKTDADFAYAVPASFLGSILRGWQVPVKVRSSRPPRRPEPELEPEPAVETDTAPVDRPPGCWAEVVSRAGAGQPVRLLASPSALAPFSLPAGTVVSVRQRLPSSGHNWYLIMVDDRQGWMQDDHLRLADGCTG